MHPSTLRVGDSILIISDWHHWWTLERENVIGGLVQGRKDNYPLFPKSRKHGETVKHSSENQITWRPRVMNGHFPLMGSRGREGCGARNVTNHRLDKPSGTNYKDKVSTRQILYSNVLQCTQEENQRDL